ncbi:hypothetical protein SiRe_2375 [Sulfolobus islandicus REY15A]|uniref:Uncharacterized protein n=1 Tax=Saccharolobus islandicus (strain REY15A) TaxID=930945 RepID=F0NFN8_SACI5|nr:hypothetical protein SiRe_2375 [Sulfolobus islandicus REY15A]
MKDWGKGWKEIMTTFCLYLFKRLKLVLRAVRLMNLLELKPLP